MPDLQKGGNLYNDRVHSLQRVLNQLGPRQEYLFQEGLTILDAHRKNYGSDGPVHLVILWWERPCFYWKILREGASMNFMTTPTPGVRSNQVRDLN